MKVKTYTRGYDATLRRAERYTNIQCSDLTEIKNVMEWHNPCASLRSRIEYREGVEAAINILREKLC